MWDWRIEVTMRQIGRPNLVDRPTKSMISAKVIADSLAPSGARLTTFLTIYPRFSHADVLRHRLVSHSVGSSRAIPVNKLIEQIRAEPAMPVFWGKNQPGMQASEEFTGLQLDKVKGVWDGAMRSMLTAAEQLTHLGLHKQLVNRIIEPWMPVTDLMSATEWDNFFFLRRDKDAQPEVQALANAMWDAREASIPRRLKAGEWHLPFIESSLDAFAANDDHVAALEYLVKHQPEDCAYGLDILKRMSAARCARTSYLNHEGTRDIAKDLELFDRLMLRSRSGKPVHASPTEHVAQATDKLEWSGNFLGFIQWRKTFSSERVGNAPGDR